jgi:hypothetical protein
MDSFVLPLNEDDKSELACRDAARAEDRSDQQPSISNEMMQAKLLKKLQELKLKIDVRSAE